MTIRVYPSRLEGEPLETHETHERLTIAEWMQSVAPDFDINAVELHPTVRVNGSIVESSEWALTYFSPSDDVDVYIEAKGSVVIAIASVVLAVVAVTMAMSMKAATPQGRKQGKAIEEAGALANQVKWGDPIPEIAGSPITYPDYITPPRRYYVNRTQQWVDSLVCIGVGEYQTDSAQMWIGDTSLPTYGDDAQVTVFQPNEEIPADLAAWWHTPEEVGFTTFGGAGMTLGPATSIDRVWSASFTFTGQNVTGSEPPPENWESGIILRIEPDHEIFFDGNTLRSAVLDTMDISIGDEIELTGEREGEYIVTGVSSGSGAVTGSAATAVGGSAPSRFDFDMTHAVLNITLNSITYTVSLTADVTNLAGLVSAINAQLNGAPVRARNVANRLELYQTEPYAGGVFSLTGDVSALMGTVTYTSGTATTAAHGATYTVTGANFGSGTEIAAAGLSGLLYTVTEITGNTIKVSPPDIEFWTGFPASVIDYSSRLHVDSGSLSAQWVGPFEVTPAGEQSNAFEVDIFHPEGLYAIGHKGGYFELTSTTHIEYREVGTTSWSRITRSRRDFVVDQIGFTYRVEHPRGRYEVRVSGKNEGWDPVSSANKQQWTGLRSRIIGAPTRYPNLTLAHVRLRSGDKVSGGVDNKFSVRARRILPTIEDPSIKEPTRDIAPFFVYMMNSVGYGRDLIDMAHIEALHRIWSDRGDTFDLSVDGSSTLKTVANYCLQAGFAELALRNGKISAARDAYRMGSPPRVYSPQEMAAPLVETTQTIMPDDIDGVDVEYVDYLTGRTLTESYRLIGDEGLRVEKIQAVGVTGRTQAWRLAARRRRMAAYRRTVYKGSTELSAMNSYYMDYVGLQDGIPEWGQSAFVIDHDGAVLTLSEDVLPVGGEPVVMLRRPDGTATPPIPATASGRRVTLAAMPPDVSVSSDPNAPTVVYIGRRAQVVHEALMTEVRPSGEARVEFQAVNMDNRVYIEDDMGPDQVILTSGLYPIIFDDSLAPSAAAPGVSWGVPTIDSMTPTLVAPTIGLRTINVKLPPTVESIAPTILAPAIERVTVADRFYSYITETVAPEMVAPSVSRFQQPFYHMQDESIAPTMVAPTITRSSS